LYGILFSIWFAIVNHTTFELISGFLISFTTTLILALVFLDNLVSIATKLSPSFPKIKDAFAV
jgi:hypothetical protein